MTQVTEKTLSFAVDQAVAKLVSTEHFHAGSIVSMPVMYPSGASVVLELSAHAGRIFVSDRGGGHQEAEFIGATRAFAREAGRIASDAGIKFDGRDMFVAEVAIDRLDAAMAVVASCSAQAAALCALKAAARDERDAKEALFDRLADVFGTMGFEREVPLLGASNHKWTVDAVVRRSGPPIIFNAVTKSYVSAAGTAAKFYDFARLEVAPTRVAVVVRRQDLGDWIGVVAAASDAVIEIAAANDQYLKMGKAA